MICIFGGKNTKIYYVAFALEALLTGDTVYTEQCANGVAEGRPSHLLETLSHMH